MSDSPFQDPRMQEIHRRRPNAWQRWRERRRLKQAFALIDVQGGRPMLLPPRNASVLWVCETCGSSTSVEMPGFAGALDANGVHCHWEYPGGYPCGPLVGHFQGYPAAAPAADPGQEVK